ncbi:MAG: helix-turn-helix transcriptional regulator [Haloarculaceae archaeon]
MLSRGPVALLALLVFLVTVAPVAGQPPAERPTAGDQASAAAALSTVPAQQSAAAADQQTMHVSLLANGSARWTVTTNYTLDTPERRAAFDDVARDFERGDLRTLSAMRAAAARASTATGRQMAITAVSRRHDVANETGRLVLSFTWTHFARESGERLIADDVFNTSAGTWLPSLSADQRLVFAGPDTYRFLSATPRGYVVSNGSVRWSGPQTFEPGKLAVVYERVEYGPPGGNWLQSNWYLLVALGGLAGAVALAYYLAERDTDLPSPGAIARSRGDDDADAAVAANGTGAAATAGSAAPDADVDAEIDEELLSDEERVERLLERNGGRMKQANIVTETGWSNAKVSQLLSAMDDEDRIDKLRIGRENLISFPDEDVTDSDERS